MTGTSTWFAFIAALIAAASAFTVIYSIYYHNRDNENPLDSRFGDQSELKIFS